MKNYSNELNDPSLISSLIAMRKIFVLIKLTDSNFDFFSGKIDGILNSKKKKPLLVWYLAPSGL